MMLGGMRLAMVDAEAISAAVNARLYPSRSISGARVRERMATSAAEEPEMPAKNMLNSVTTCARPPRKCPTSVCDSRIMRTVTLAEVIRSPTSRKNGTASSASTSMPLKSCAIIEARLTGVNAVTTSTAAISANATGTPI